MAKYPPSAYDDASLFSDISSLEGSDDFGRKLLQHTKDAQRISNLNSHSQAFRKAKPLPRAALNLDNLERNNLRDSPNHATDPYRPPSVASSNTSDPPLNLPREWGRKGRHNHSWMRQIYKHEQTPPQDQSPNIDWIHAANDNLHSTPTSLRQQQDSNVRHWDSDTDFSAASLLASTPALPSRTRLTVEEIREREIQTAATRSSIYRRQAQQQTTSETLTRRFGDSFADAAAISRSASAPGSKTNIANKENIPVQNSNSLHGYYRSIETYDPVVSDTPRPEQKRLDSMTLLRRLSRTPSASPSPTPAKETVPPPRSKQKEPERSETFSKSAASHNTDHMHMHFRESSPQAPEVVTGPQSVNLPQGDSSQAPEVVDPSKPPTFTPLRPTEQSLPAQTPKVMGGWVDTPQTTIRTTDRITSQGAPENSDRNPQPGDIIADAVRPRTRSEPNLPVSALDAVLKNLRDGTGKEDDDPTLGDSTIASLEEVMNPSADNTQRLDLPDVRSAQPRSYLKDTKKAPPAEQQQNNERKEESIDAVPTTQKQRDERQKWFALEALKKRFSGTSAKYKPVRETRKTKSPREFSATSQPAPSPLVETASPYMHQHAAGTHCAQCGRPMSVFRAAWSEYWGLYFRRDPQSRLGIRLTWFGLSCALFWGWLITELILGRIFTPPLYAARMQGYGVDPDAPRFPYVLPTLILRPFSPILTPLMSLATWSSTAVYGEPEFKYYPASPGAWGPAAKVRIRPPGPRSAYHTGTDRTADHVVWSDEETISRGWHSSGGKVQKMNVWSEGQVAWEANEDESMLEDEVM